jgi:hypothetical protein
MSRRAGWNKCPHRGVAEYPPEAGMEPRGGQKNTLRRGNRPERGPPLWFVFTALFPRPFLVYYPHEP